VLTAALLIQRVTFWFSTHFFPLNAAEKNCVCVVTIPQLFFQLARTAKHGTLFDQWQRFN
jgi:hypothetical protein